MIKTSWIVGAPIEQEMKTTNLSFTLSLNFAQTLEFYISSGIPLMFVALYLL
jgi:hypothetical protein